MRGTRLVWLMPAVALALLLVPASTSAHTASGPTSLAGGTGGGEVFTMTNALSGNHVIAFHASTSGVLVPAGTFATGGVGTGSSLADQGALVLTADHHYLLVVNAGDNTVSVFRVNAYDPPSPLLSLVDLRSSWGAMPVSLAVHGTLVYVLNAGDASTPGNIAGFWLGSGGTLHHVAGSHRSLSTSALVGPAEVEFSPSGSVLVVSEKTTSRIDVYPVASNGVALPRVTTASNGTTPYGFEFGRKGTLVVSDAGPGALSSYSVAPSGKLTVISGSIPDGQLAPCWVAIAGGGEWAFTSNAHSGTISLYAISSTGALSLKAAIAGTTGPADTDLAVGGGSSPFLFVLDSGTPEIQDFAIGPGGSLTPLFGAYSLPPTTEGLAAF